MSMIRPVANDKSRARRPEREPSDDQPRAMRGAQAPEDQRTDRIDPERNGIDQRELRRAETELRTNLRQNGDEDLPARRAEKRRRPQQPDEQPRIVGEARVGRCRCATLFDDAHRSRSQCNLTAVCSRLPRPHNAQRARAVAQRPTAAACRESQRPRRGCATNTSLRIEFIVLRADVWHALCSTGERPVMRSATSARLSTAPHRTLGGERPMRPWRNEHDRADIALSYPQRRDGRNSPCARTRLRSPVMAREITCAELFAILPQDFATFAPPVGAARAMDCR